MAKDFLQLQFSLITSLFQQTKLWIFCITCNWLYFTQNQQNFNYNIWEFSQQIQSLLLQQSQQGDPAGIAYRCLASSRCLVNLSHSWVYCQSFVALQKQHSNGGQPSYRMGSLMWSSTWKTSLGEKDLLFTLSCNLFVVYETFYQLVWSRWSSVISRDSDGVGAEESGRETERDNVREDRERERERERAKEERDRGRGEMVKKERYSNWENRLKVKSMDEIKTVGYRER